MHPRGVCPCFCACKDLITSGTPGVGKENGGRRLYSFWQDKCFALVVPVDLFSLVSEMLVLPLDPPVVDLCVRCLAEQLLQSSPCVSPAPGCSARLGAAGMEATGDLKTPRSCSGCSCRPVCPSERLSPALWGRSSQKEERFLQGEGLRGNSTGSSAKVHVSLGISIRALFPQPQRKDANIYLQSGQWDLHQPPIAPSKLPYQTGGQPRSVFWLQRGHHMASPGLCPLGRSCPRSCFAPALLNQGKSLLAALGQVSSPRTNIRGLHESLLGACPGTEPGGDRPRWDTPPPRHSFVLLVPLLPVCCLRQLMRRRFRAEH